MEPLAIERSTTLESAVWSPDSKALLYRYLRFDGNSTAARMAVRYLAGQERLVTGWSRDLLFSPSHWTSIGVLGTYLSATLTGDASLALWSARDFDAPGPERVLVSAPKGSIWQAMLSPNRRWVSFILVRAERPGIIELTVASAHGPSSQQLIRIAADHVRPDKPRWAPDGRTLYFLSRHPAPYFNVWGVSFDPDRGTPVGEPFALTTFDSPALHVSPHLQQAEMGVSSAHMMLTMKAVSGSIWMLDGVDR